MGASSDPPRRRERAPSPLRAALRVIAAGVRRRGETGGAPAGTPRRRVAAERAAIPIDPRRVSRYRAVTGGGEGGDPAVVPPVYASTWETALALELFATGELPLPTRGLVHLESELVALRPIRAADRVRCRVELDRVEPHRRGARVELRSRNWNAAGQLCQENTLVFLVPGAGVEGPRGAPTREPAAGAASTEWRPLAEWSVPANHGRRYARVSGDFNPIHLWGWSSRLLGFDRPILQGFCIQAMVAGALAGRHWRGDPAALRRLRVTFHHPLFLPGRVLLREACDPGGGRGRFELTDRDSSSRPLAAGEFVGG